MRNLERGYRYATIEHKDYAEIIGRRLCLNPQKVTNFLRKLDNNPGKAYSKFLSLWKDNEEMITHELFLIN